MVMAKAHADNRWPASKTLVYVGRVLTVGRLNHVYENSTPLIKKPYPVLNTALTFIVYDECINETWRFR